MPLLYSALSFILYRVCLIFTGKEGVGEEFWSLEDVLAADSVLPVTSAASLRFKGGRGNYEK